MTTASCANAWHSLEGYLAKKLTYSQAMGKLGDYVANPPKQVDQTELDLITEKYLLQGKRPQKGSNWLTRRQLQSRQESELQFGGHIGRASRTSSHWISQMPRLPRITQPEY
jgi:hypothetical protein